IPWRKPWWLIWSTASPYQSRSRSKASTPARIAFTRLGGSFTAVATSLARRPSRRASHARRSAVVRTGGGLRWASNNGRFEAVPPAGARRRAREWRRGRQLGGGMAGGEHQRRVRGPPAGGDQPLDLSVRRLSQ